MYTTHHCENGRLVEFFFSHMLFGFFASTVILLFLRFLSVHSFWGHLGEGWEEEKSKINSKRLKHIVFFYIGCISYWIYNHPVIDNDCCCMKYMQTDIHSLALIAHDNAKTRNEEAKKPNQKWNGRKKLARTCNETKPTKCYYMWCMFLSGISTFQNGFSMCVCVCAQRSMRERKIKRDRAGLDMVRVLNFLSQESSDSGDDLQNSYANQNSRFKECESMHCTKEFICSKIHIYLNEGAHYIFPYHTKHKPWN